MKYIIRIILILFLFPTAFAEQIEITVDGKKTDLPYWPAKKEHYGAVLMINGGLQAQASVILDHLTNQFAENGWGVVSLNHEKSISVSWVKFLPEVITTLRQQKNKRLVILHYGEQLQETLLPLDSPSMPEIEGLVLLSAYNMAQPATTPRELNMPVFDIIGQFDFDLVKKAMRLRHKEFERNKSNYLSIEIPGTHHDYEYSQQLLFSFIYGWMMKLPEFHPKAPSVMYS